MAVSVFYFKRDNCSGDLCAAHRKPKIQGSKSAIPVKESPLNPAAI